MNETLWAVIIGGSIGVAGGIATTILTFLANHYRWKKEKKLEYLKAERRHQEEKYKYLLSKLPEAIEDNLPGYDIVTEMSLDLPEKIRDKITSDIDEIQKNRQEGKKIDVSVVTFSMTNFMQESLDEIDKKIKELLS